MSIAGCAFPALQSFTSSARRLQPLKSTDATTTKSATFCMAYPETLLFAAGLTPVESDQILAAILDVLDPRGRARVAAPGCARLRVAVFRRQLAFCLSAGRRLSGEFASGFDRALLRGLVRDIAVIDQKATAVFDSRNPSRRPRVATPRFAGC